MSNIEDTVSKTPAGRSALEKHIFGIQDEMPPVDVSVSPSLSHMPSPPASREEASIMLRKAIDAHESGAYEEAENHYKALLLEHQNIPSAWMNLGVLLRRRHKLEAAIICMRRGLAIKSDDGPSWSNLGNALRDLGRYEEATKAHLHAIELNPGAAQIHYNLGLVHRDLGHLSDAEDCFRRAELLGYDQSDLTWDHALLNLMQGRFLEGFAGFESRWQSHNLSPEFPEIPIWKGANLTGQSLLVYSEKGLGDTIQFSRYLSMLDGRAETILFLCDPSLARLMKSSQQFRNIQIFDTDQELPEDIDAVIPLLSLPKMMETTAETIPLEVPYLKAPADDVPILNKGNSSILRVGIAWAGDTLHKNDQNRSIDIAQLSKILDLPKIQFYSLQVGERSSDIEAQMFDPMLRDLSPHIRDFADTASLMQSLDLVISADTAVGHLSGALNKPTWLLLPFAPDWRWQTIRGDSLWYPSMFLIRQTSPGDWQEVFYRVRGRLIQMLHEKNTVK